MNRTGLMKVAWVVLTASLALSAQAETGDRLKRDPPSIAPGRDFVPDDRKIPPGLSPADMARLEKCKPDPRTGQMRCQGAPPREYEPKAGERCQTEAGVQGIWVKKDRDSPLSCAVAGDGCYAESGSPGKVFAGKETMRCAAAGESCPRGDRNGQVFVEQGVLTCLIVGDSCTCPGGKSGCKAVGPTNAGRYLCAKAFVNCSRLPSQGHMALLPTQGVATGSVAVGLVGQPPGAEAASVTCSAAVSGLPKGLSYSIPCHGAYASTTEGPRWRACKDNPQATTRWVKCDVPGIVAVTTDVAPSDLGPGSVSVLSSHADFVGSTNDSARERAICSYRVDAATYKVKVPCLAPMKVDNNSFVCN